MWMVEVVRIYTGPDNGSYFEDLEVERQFVITIAGPRRSLIVPLAEDFDIRRWARPR